MNRTLSAILISSLLFPVAHAGRKKDPAPDRDEVGAVLMGQALTSDGAWDKLLELCDGIGHRLSGSPELEQAVKWAEAKMAEEGMEASTEEVMVPAWIRGHQKATLLNPVRRPLNILTLGRSVGTPDGAITADVLVVSSWDELEARKDEVEGKIVLYDVPFTTYGKTVDYRGNGANAASKHGAVGVLVRSVTSHSLDTPHTGAMRPYEKGLKAIPAAAVTIEEAELMHRLQDAGQTPRVTLDLGAQTVDDRPSANVIGEIKGRSLPDEIVVMGCHLDSWDVGQGAQDDGAGCVAAMEAGRLIAGLDVAPARTVRVVLFTNEENGLAGGTAYAEAHAGETIVAAMEMDTGAGEPQGWRVDVRRGDEENASALQQDAIATLEPLRQMLEPVGGHELVPSFSGADIGPLVEQGVLGLGLKQDTTGYWPIHHTRADTIDKIDPDALKRNVAMMAVTAWWLAESAEPVLPNP